MLASVGGYLYISPRVEGMRMLARVRQAVGKWTQRPAAARAVVVEEPSPAGAEPEPDSRTAPKLLCLPNDYQAPQPDFAGADSGVIYAHSHELPVGRLVLRCALQLPDAAPPGAAVTIECVSGERTFGSLTLPMDDDLRAMADAIDLTFDMPVMAVTDIRVRVSAGLYRTHLRYLDLQPLSMWGKNYELDYAYPFQAQYDHFPTRKLRNVIIGTIGVCNASCPHCPTNKPMSEHLVGGPMDWALFARMIDQITEGGFAIEGVLAFGLHGDALMDPLVVKRARYVKEKLPNAQLLMNTNAGPWNEARHAELIALVDIWSIHVEAVDPELYARLMAPLRARIVYPKVARIIELAPGKVSIAAPLSQANLPEFAALKAYWAEKGAPVMPLAFANRTIDTLNFYDYALAPVPGACRQEVAAELVVDWDGLVLACCQDFSRGNQIGDLTKESLLEVLGNAERRKLFETMKHGRWSDYRTCRDCKFDQQGEVDRLVAAAV